MSYEFIPCKVCLLRFAKLKDNFTALLVLLYCKLHFDCQELHKPNFDFALISIHNIFTEISISLCLVCLYFLHILVRWRLKYIKPGSLYTLRALSIQFR